jgi:hypothetical protein
MVTNHRLIVLSGIPAIGKTHFGRWLTREHGFIHVEFEDKRVREAHGLAGGRNALKGSGNADPLITSVQNLGPRVLFDWGFPPAWLFAVTRFAELGAELWWFDGDRVRARQDFVERNTVAPDAFDRQLLRITQSWSAITALFGQRQIDVLSANGKRMPAQSIWTAMNQDAF